MSTKIYRANKKKGKGKRSVQLLSQRTEDQCESRAAIKELQTETESRKLSGGGGESAVELTEDLERSDEADEAEAHDEHDGWQDLQEGG